MIREGKNFCVMIADCLGEGDAANRKMNVDDGNNDENSETPANHSDDQVRGKKKNGIKCFKPRGRVSSFFFTVAFLLFLTPAGGSNPAGQSLTFN